jgi:hypothetical protein
MTTAASARALLVKLGAGRARNKRNAEDQGDTPNATSRDCFTDPELLAEACARLDDRGEEGEPRHRGQLMHMLLSESLSLSAPLDHVSMLPPENWDPAWFDAANPRAFLPVDRALSLLHSQGRSAAQHALSAALAAAPAAACLLRMLASDYVWMPALAWALERLPPPVLVALCEQVFGPDSRRQGEGGPPPGPRQPHQAQIDAAIMRENLARALARLESVLLACFAPAAAAPAAAPAAPPLPVLVLRLARLVLHVRLAAGGEGAAAAQVASGGVLRAPASEAELKVIRQGLLGCVIRLPPAPDHCQPAMQEALRAAGVEEPWAVCFAKM